jgi:8-oxo-dGTP diphosphatase
MSETGVQFRRGRAAAIIIENKSLLVIHRIKNGREYYILPGGGIESNENIEAACIREVKEETGLHVTQLSPIFAYNNQGNSETYFRVQVISGTPILGKPEVDQHSPEDQYLLEWIAYDQLSKINLLPDAAKTLCLEIMQSIL